MSSAGGSICVMLAAVEPLLAPLEACLQDVTSGAEGVEAADSSPPPLATVDGSLGVAGAAKAVDDAAAAAPLPGTAPSPALGNGFAAPGPVDVSSEMTDGSALLAA